MTILSTLAASLTLMTCVWAFSLPLRDASIVDRFWGLALVLQATLMVLLEGPAPRALLVAGLVCLWGIRLSLYITLRNWGGGEDRRYGAMRARGGSAFPVRSLYSIFLLQGVLAWIIALPLYPAITHDAAFPAPWDLLGAAVVVAGILIESIADWQMARHRRLRRSASSVLDRGLWRYSRHPNYFGEALVWWGFFLMSCASPWGPWTVFSPVLMTWLLVRVSGVPLLEKDLRRRNPAYAEYTRRTPAFVPWFPRKV